MECPVESNSASVCYNLPSKCMWRKVKQKYFVVSPHQNHHHHRRHHHHHILIIIRYSTWEPEENILDPRLIQQFTQKEADRIQGKDIWNSQINSNSFWQSPPSQKAARTRGRNVGENRKLRKRRNNPRGQKAGKRGMVTMIMRNRNKPRLWPNCFWPGKRTRQAQPRQGTARRRRRNQQRRRRRRRSRPSQPSSERHCQVEHCLVRFPNPPDYD